MVTVNAPDNTNDTTPTIGGTTDLPAGSVITVVVTDSAGAAQTLTATVQAGGTYSVDVVTPLAEGNYSATATATDTAGNSATVSDPGSVNSDAPALTVNAPDNTNDTTPTVTGTTDLPAGSVITVVVTDSAGAAQTLTATVQAGGTYSVDVVTPLAEGPYTAVASAEDSAGNTTTASDPGSVDTTPPALTVNAPDNTSDTTPTITGTTDLPAGSEVTVVVTDSAGAAQTLTATVQAGGGYSVDVATPLADGPYTADASATDAAGNTATANDPGSVNSDAPALTVNAPDNTNDTTPTITGTTDLPAGSTVTVVVTDSAGAQQTLTATVQAGGTYSVDVVTPLADGTYTALASATDTAGNTATASDPGSVDTLAPVLTVIAPDNTTDNTPTITGTTDLPAGSLVTVVVTDSAGAQQTLTATVQAGGGYSVDVATPLADGPYTADASATDAAGNTATASDPGSVDTLAPVLTVNAPDNTSDTTPALTGTTDLPGGSVITLVVTDNAGAQQTLVATVQPGGTYSVDVANPLAEGPYTVTASGQDPAGNVATATDPGSVNSLAPSLTVDAPDNTSDTTPTVTGTTDLPVGSEVTVVVTDSAGAVQTLTATVQAGGTYSVDVVTPLAEGPYTATASAQDSAGNTTTASDPGSVDLTPPVVTVDAPDNTSDTTPTVSGTTDLPAGSVITVVVTDSAGAVQTLTATVQAGGTYSVGVGTPLAEGPYTATASGTDAAGNTGTATDPGSVNSDAPALTVDAPDNTNDTTPAITGTTDLPEGTLVTITVTDSAGNVQTLIASVLADGTYSVDVGTPLAEGPYTATASAEDSAGNATTASDPGSVDATPPVITVNAPDNTRDNTPTITGTTDLPAGSVVTVVVTDVNGSSQTLTATVQADGTYSVDVATPLPDGPYTALASGVDAAGNGATADDPGSVDTTPPIVTVSAPDNTKGQYADDQRDDGPACGQRGDGGGDGQRWRAADAGGDGAAGRCVQR